MSNEAKVIPINSAAHGKKPLTEAEQNARLLAALQPSTELEQTRDLREVMESITSELLRLEHRNPDSRSLHTAGQHAECCLHALKQREAALTINEPAF